MMRRDFHLSGFIVELMIFIFSSMFASLGYAQWDDNRLYTVLEEDFEGKFPPPGWRLISNTEYTWKQSGVELEGRCVPESGNKLIYIEAVEGEVYDEQLITPLMKTKELWDTELPMCYQMILWLYEETSTDSDEYSPVLIEYRCNVENRPWEKAEYYFNSNEDRGNLSRLIGIIDIDVGDDKDCYTDGMYLRFRYIGDSKIGTCMDSLRVDYVGYYEGGGDDSEDDDDDDDDDDSACCG